MALINNLYIFVENESVKESINSTSHPTEKGLPITSTIQKEPTELTIQGKIVKNKKVDAKTAKSKIEKLKNSGSLVTYKGRTTLKNMQIQSFDYEYSNKVWGGFDFSMTLKQVRIAKPSYGKKKKSNVVIKAGKASNPKLEVGATVIFKGGNVYVSSDAKKPSAKRGRSTCKITKIKNASWAVHKYHLISKDGKMVYGWVDKSDIEGIQSSSIGNKKNTGTKQVNEGKGKAVYHKVKKGDTVYNLVNKNYKSLGKSVSWVLKNNPKGFSKKNDPKTLKIGVKLLVGYK